MQGKDNVFVFNSDKLNSKALTETMEENKSDQIVAKLHKISAQDITPARKIILSLPYICKLLTTEVGLKGTHHLCIVCGLAFLSMTV